MRVLLAEDDEGLRSVLERGLRENGYVVDATVDGQQALRYLDAYDYEVAILDWRMPKVTGLEVIQQLRRRGSSLPVLMLTARDAAGDRVTGLDEGADDYLIKPFDFAELLARIRALQRRGEAMQSLLDQGGRRDSRHRHPRSGRRRCAPASYRYRTRHFGDLVAAITCGRFTAVDCLGRVGRRGRRPRVEHA